MNILFANSFYWPDIGGGAERSVKRIADLHIKAGHQVSVLTTHQGSKTVVEDVDGVSVHRIPPHNLFWPLGSDKPMAWKRLLWHGFDSYNFQSAKSAQEVLSSVKPDIISCQNLSGLSASMWPLARKMGIPVIQVLRDYYHICPRGTCYGSGRICTTPCNRCSIFRLPHRSLSNNVTAVVGCSNAVLKKHLDQGFFENTQIKTVIYNAEDITPAEKAASMPESHEEVFTLGYIGALTEVKGIAEMLEAVKKAQAKSSKRIVLLLAGKGPEHYVQMLKKRFESTEIIFLGHVASNLFFTKIDASIVPSVWDDPLPGVVFQALAHNLPVIGANRGGIPEMVKHQVNGLLYEPDTEDALSEAILQLCENQNLFSKLSACARSSASTFLDEARMFDEYMSLYAAVLK